MPEADSSVPVTTIHAFPYAVNLRKQLKLMLNPPYQDCVVQDWRNRCSLARLEGIALVLEGEDPEEYMLVETDCWKRTDIEDCWIDGFKEKFTWKDFAGEFEARCLLPSAVLTMKLTFEESFTIRIPNEFPEPVFRVRFKRSWEDKVIGGMRRDKWFASVDNGHVEMELSMRFDLTDLSD